MTIDSLQKLLHAFSSYGATHVLCKKLAPNDNSKNQVYLGGSFDVLNIIPFEEIRVDTSAKDAKRHRYKTSLAFSWITLEGGIEKAASAQLILYPKYPEVRLSGFLKGCKSAPSEIMTSRAEGRHLFLGITPQDTILAFATKQDSEIVAELDAIEEPEIRGVFQFLSITDSRNKTGKELLLEKLREIHLMGWIKSVRLTSSGALKECTASNCGGYTLEAQLGIVPNGDNAPDFMGWELKQVGGNKPNVFPNKAVSLMDPQPTGGQYIDEGFMSFMRTYGYLPKKKFQEGRLNMSTPHKANMRVENTGLTLKLLGYDAGTGKINDVNGMICLVNDTDGVAASWSFAHLLKVWNNKHLKAAYVPSMCLKDPYRQYHYGSKVKLGEGTDFLKFLKLLSMGIVYYDPGNKVENLHLQKPTTKRRNLFRVKFGDMGGLYDSFTEVDLL